MQRISRRAILTGAATLPAMSIPAVAAENPKLLAIGEKIKALWPAYQEADARSRELYDQACEVAGWNDPDREKALRDGRMTREEDMARWEAAGEQTGYSAAIDRTNRLAGRIWPLAKAAGELNANTVAGYGVLAVAAIIQDEFESAPAAYDTLVALAEAAGFDVT